MDTRFWGPSGWRFLHMVTFAYDPKHQKNEMKHFFELLPFALPCKYCRSNLVQHYEKKPLEPALQSQESLAKWLYDIHNLVNEKLRDQGQVVEQDPPFSKVKEHYKERLAYGCSKTFFPGWEFLFSIIEDHPFANHAKLQPLPNAPLRETIPSEDSMTLLRWNYLSKKSRYDAICKFWTVLPSVLPFEEWKEIWKRSGMTTFPKEKTTAFFALWATRKRIEDELDLLNKTSYHDLCKMIRYYKSGCASSKKASTVTCRRIRNSTRKQKGK